MGKIIVLDENTANKIAAGEVIERPASVIKELAENSMDAGAANISVDIRNGGISFIKIIDNGSGMDEDDVEIAFERHATSKIRSADDLESVLTMGFRGEALASIAAVSDVHLVTRTAAKSHGTQIEIKGGRVLDVRQTGCPVGTTITVKDLFFNTPARYKFLKKDTTEAGYVSDIISRMALGNPQVSFKLTSGGATVLHTPGNNDQLSAIFSIYGKETAREVYPVEYEDYGIKVTGYAGKPEIARSNRSQQSVYLNRRFIRNKTVTSAIDEAYQTFLMKNRFPFIVLNLEVNPVLVDVNVHPTKMEVKFSNEQDVFKAVYHAVHNALMNRTEIRSVQLGAQERNPFRKKDEESPRVDYKQETIRVAVSHPGTTPAPVAASRQTTPVPAKAPSDASVNPIVAPTPTASDDYTDLTGPIGTEPVVSEEPVLFETPAALQPEQEQETQAPSADENPSAGEINELQGARLIGQAFSTYILLQKGEELILVDQHAAHERIMYEDLKRKMESKKPLSQMLLANIVIELTHKEIKFLEEQKEHFESLGFEYESFGTNAVLLRAVPYGDLGNESKQLFLEILDHWMEHGKSRTPSTDEALYTIACKAAVKANRKLDEREINQIFNELSRMENPYTCPHGRPTAIKIRKYDLEKMFKRIV